MIQYPLFFKASAHARTGMMGSWEATCAEGKLNCAVPKEFEGPGGALSPEDLFAQALTNCFIATFQVYAHHSKLTFEGIKVDSSLVVDKESGKPVMKEISFRVELAGASHPDRAQLLVKKAMDSGFVLNSVTTKKSYELVLV